MPKKPKTITAVQVDELRGLLRRLPYTSVGVGIFFLVYLCVISGFTGGVFDRSIFWFSLIFASVVASVTYISLRVAIGSLLKLPLSPVAEWKGEWLTVDRREQLIRSIKRTWPLWGLSIGFCGFCVGVTGLTLNPDFPAWTVTFAVLVLGCAWSYYYLVHRRPRFLRQLPALGDPGTPWNEVVVEVDPRQR